MIELTINNTKIKAKKGSTILQAALANGIYIPNFCYDKRLVPYGGCRVCIVEIEGQRKLEASCATLAKEGMIVNSESPKVRKARQTVLELMLVHHPLDCPVCDKAGECDLQEIVFKYGKPEGRFIRDRKDSVSDVRGPLVELTANVSESALNTRDAVLSGLSAEDSLQQYSQHSAKYSSATTVDSVLISVQQEPSSARPQDF